jgi:hypothetical protein
VNAKDGSDTSVLGFGNLQMKGGGDFSSKIIAEFHY